MSSRDQWLAAGARLLAARGEPGLTTERLVAEVGLTKGSFYHHFGGMPGFRTALLAHVEATETTRYLELADAAPGGPAARLHRLLELICAEGETWALEVALRAWAAADAEAGAAQRRVDQRRRDYLQEVWAGLGHPPETATRLAELTYLLFVGAGHVAPPVSPPHLGELYRLLLELAGVDRP